MPAPPLGDEAARESGRERPQPQGTWPSVGLHGTSESGASVLTRDLFPLGARSGHGRPEPRRREAPYPGKAGRYAGPLLHGSAECSPIAGARSPSLEAPQTRSRRLGAPPRQALPLRGAGVLRLAPASCLVPLAERMDSEWESPPSLTVSVFRSTIEAMKTDTGHSPVQILTAEWQVVGRLEQLCLTRAGLMEVVHQCVAGYGGCTDNDPPGARGYEVWRMGVRAFREVFGGKQGWDKNESGGFSTIANHKLGIRIAGVTIN